MTRKKSKREQALADLRRDFEAGFARAPVSDAEAGLRDLLAIRVGGEPYALALDEIAKLAVEPSVIDLPGSPRSMVGLASLRGVLVPVYDLAALLGLAQAEKPRWLALCAGGAPLGLAFDEFEEHLRVPAASIASPQGHGETWSSAAARDDAPGAASGLTRGLVRTGEAVRPLVHVESLRARVARRVQDHRS